MSMQGASGGFKVPGLQGLAHCAFCGAPLAEVRDEVVPAVQNKAAGEIQLCPQCGSSRSRDEQPPAVATAPVDATLLAQLTGGISAGLVIVDSTGTITFANDTAHRMIGCHDLAGRRYDDPGGTLRTVEGMPVPASEHPVAQVQRTRSPISGATYLFERHAGCRLWLSLDVTPLFDNTGSVVGIGVAFGSRPNLIRMRPTLRLRSMTFPRCFTSTTN